MALRKFRGLLGVLFMILVVYFSSLYQIHSRLTSQAAPETNESFSACLLVMDDNHFLVEWLAYHYFVVNLRHLIVAIDPRSQTSPVSILKRWQDRMDVQIWNDDDYMKEGELDSDKKVVKRKFGDIEDNVLTHRARQRIFYYKCMSQLKQAGSNWTMMTDTDEYVLLNKDEVSKNGLEYIPIQEKGSVHRFLKQEAKTAIATQIETNWTRPCVQIPRIRFGAQESDIAHIDPDQLPPSVDRSSLGTLRWQHSADYSNSGASKVIIDLSRTAWDDLEPVSSIHRPVVNLCGRRKVYIRKDEQTVMIHHYLGSWEQYTFRDDARKGDIRSKEAFRKAQHFGTRGRVDDDLIHGWLTGFVADVGPDMASKLLEGAGKVDPK